MKATIPIAVPPSLRVLRLERAKGEYWKIWIHHDRLMTQGTFLRLYDNGAMDQVTTDEDGIERIMRIKPHDNHEDNNTSRS